MLDSVIRIATRRSPLAIAQAETVGAALMAAHSGLSFELVRLETAGDVQLSGPLFAMGGKGLFVKEIQAALLDGRADLAVHSAKDYPQENPPGLHIAAVPARASDADLLLTRDGRALSELDAGARVGSSSLRRIGQLRAQRGDLRWVNLRGNVGSRLAKLQAGECDAIVLAAAGLERLGLAEWLARGVVLPIVPSAGQGALIIECRTEDARAHALALKLSDHAAQREVAAERAFVSALGGDCATPLGARAIVAAGAGEHDHAPWRSFTGVLVAADGGTLLRVELAAEEFALPAPAAGARLAEKLLDDPRARPLLLRPPPQA